MIKAHVWDGNDSKQSSKLEGMVAFDCALLVAARAVLTESRVAFGGSVAKNECVNNYIFDTIDYVL